MKWAVEHYVYDTGRSETRTRSARRWERMFWVVSDNFTKYLDILDTRGEARALAEMYEGKCIR